MTQIGAGDVTITLSGNQVTLRPTLRAAQTISRQAGGIVGAMQAVGKFDFDVIANVVALGIGKTRPEEIQQVAEQVYETGLTDLVPHVTTYLTNLANGGRAMAKAGGENPQG
jgi:adenylosuccinate lyase